ncbi:MAG: tRNA pseudouridine(38-40) synthase TruA [Candidatus Rokubacteria bacterium]|nr:tRNA pseudouridine(38-40) synthase TruA [Candidatus Rokubacteria bacterium]
MVSYDGTAYAGWQAQPGPPTIQALLTREARRLSGPDARVTGASRTDAGVHALRQTVSLTTTSALPPAAILGALNAALPPDVRVREAADAASGFHARFGARGKRYAYLVDNARVPSPLLRRFAWHVPAPLDVARMRAALGALRGRHDFAAFRAAAGREQDPVCTVRAVHVFRRRDRVALLISADRYLHHMVRTIVGSAVDVGRGAREPGWLADVLAGRDRRRAGPTAPAHGLTLVRVMYGAGG